VHERPLRLDSKGWLEAVNRFVVLVQRLVLKLYYQSRAAGSEASGAVLVLRLVLSCTTRVERLAGKQAARILYYGSY
jgi:hypothetical protein